MKQIELLSPAKNLECGLAAVNHGADAVYIGAPQFSARANAGNSIADIETLAAYAHRFNAKVLVALNTVLTDRQLPEAERLAHQLYEAGADALIVQDMGLLQLDLPPIALHASTQTDNRTAEKVRFLEQAGFSRVVLARELSIDQIRHIASHTRVELEAFIHGALCVSYSGRCYMSQAMCGRSANRGECAQYCRLPYDLVDAEGKVLVHNKHLLSLKDLNLAASLEELIDAGVSSLKIEGRLKDADYVKNITACYRRELDRILDRRSDCRKASTGRTRFFFEPAPAKSFNRGFSDYFLHGRQRDIIQPDSPKSFGEPIGSVKACRGRTFSLTGTTRINNGDGLCFVNRQGLLEGFRVNRAEGDTIYPAAMPALTPGTVVYRNRDVEFEKALQQKTAERKIAVDIRFAETGEGFCIQCTDEEGVSASCTFACEKQTADNPQRAAESIYSRLARLGGTIYEARQVDVLWQTPYFFPNSVLNEWRRQAVERLDEARRAAYHRPQRLPADPAAPFPVAALDYTGNVTNRTAETFYRRHGVQTVAPGFEAQPPRESVPLMYCKHCIKYALGLCAKQGCKEKTAEPLFLRNSGRLYRLTFDCKECEMRVELT